MTSPTRFDPRVAGLSQQVGTSAAPQQLFHDKALNVRSEYIDGALHLYRYTDILAINRHPKVLGNGGRGGTFGNDDPLIPLEVDGEDHRKWRRLLDPMFAPKQMAALDAQIRELAGELIDAFAAERGAELFTALCTPLPCLTFLRLVGAPVEDLDFFLEFKEGVVHPKGDTAEELDANMAASGAKLLEYFSTFLTEKRKTAHREDDVLAKIMTGQVDGRPVTELELINIAFLFMFAGLDTVTSALSCILAWLGQHPDNYRMLVEDRALVPGAVEELIRYESPVPSGIRFAEEDIELGDGLVVPSGDVINAYWAAGNLDPTYHDDPLTVDFKRGRKDHLVFASGTHRCLGSHLARMEMRLALDEFLNRIPAFSVDVGALAYNNFAVRAATTLQVNFADN